LNGEKIRFFASSPLKRRRRRRREGGGDEEGREDWVIFGPQNERLGCLGRKKRTHLL